MIFKGCFPYLVFLAIAATKLAVLFANENIKLFGYPVYLANLLGRLQTCPYSKIGKSLRKAIKKALLTVRKR